MKEDLEGVSLAAQIYRLWEKTVRIGNCHMFTSIATIQGRAEQTYLTWIGISIGKLPPPHHQHATPPPPQSRAI